MKIHEYNEMMRHLTRREPSDKHLAAMPLYEQGGRVGYRTGKTVRGSTIATQKPVEFYVDIVRNMIKDSKYVPPVNINAREVGTIPNFKKAKELVKAETGESFDVLYKRNIKKRKDIKRAADPEKRQRDLISMAERKGRRRVLKADPSDPVTITDRERALNFEQRKYNKDLNLKIRQDPDIILKDKMLMDKLSTTVSKDGNIIKVKPTLDDIKNRGIVEVEHQRDIYKKGKLKDLPYNRNFILGPYNREGGFKKMAETFIEKNPDANNIKVKNIIKKAEELGVTLQPNVPKGTFPTKGIGYKQVGGPVEKFANAAAHSLQGSKLDLSPKKSVADLQKLMQGFCGYGKSAGGRIGFNKGSCSPEVAQRNFLMATDDVAKGRVTGKAAEQITKNAGKIVAKAGSKSALMSILGPAGLGLDIAFEIGSIGTDMAMDSNVTLKGALQNNWLTGFFMKGTGQEEYHKGLFAKDSSAKPFGTAMDLYAKIEEEERALKRMTTGSDRVTVTEEMLSAQKQKIADLSSFFDKLARKEGGRYLALEKGSPEQVAYERAKQEYDSTGAAKALLKRTSKADFEDSLKTSRTKPYEDYIKTLNPTYGVKHTYGNISKKEIDKMLKAYGDEQGFGWTPYGLGYGMEQRYTQPGIGDRKYNEDLAYRQLAEDITNTQARSAIAEAGGVANMAAGGRVPLSKAGSVDKARRAFLKWLAGLTGAAVAGGTGFIKLGKGAKTVAPKVTEEVIKRGADGMPTYIDNLINVVQSKGIKKLVDSNINKMPDTVHTYKGVEITQDAAGNTRIKKGKEISVSGSDEPGYHELEMEINRGGIGVKDEGLETQKTFQEPDEYLEGTVRPDIDGKMKDVDFHIDDADHIELKKIADEGTYDTYLPDIDDID